MAQGWPVCGTSEVCFNEEIPIRAIVMLSQAREDHAELLSPGKAFPLVYSQITVVEYERTSACHGLDGGPVEKCTRVSSGMYDLRKGGGVSGGYIGNIIFCAIAQKG